jgi:hypothetical protein
MDTVAEFIDPPCLRGQRGKPGGPDFSMGSTSKPRGHAIKIHGGSRRKVLESRFCQAHIPALPQPKGGG